MSDKPLAEMTAQEFDATAKMTRMASVGLTIGIVVVVGYMVFDLLENTMEMQTAFVVIFCAFTFIGVFSLQLTLANQHLRLRRDLWDVLQEVRGSRG